MTEPRLHSLWHHAGGLRLHAREGGAPGPGTQVVLVHGLIVSSLYMVPLARVLARDHHVLAPDLPGFGLSDAPRGVPDIPGLAGWLLRWMDAAGIGRAALFGNSLGCQVIAHLAADHPDRVERIVLSGPTYDPAARRAAPQIGRWLRDCLYEHPRLMAVNVRDFLRAGPRRGVRTFRRSLADRIELQLPRIAAPALVVLGTRDPIVPRRWAEEAARRLPRGRLVEIAGPHCVNFTTPQALARVMRPFLAEGAALRERAS